MDPLLVAGTAVLVVLLTVLRITLGSQARRAGRRVRLPWYLALPLFLLVAGVLAYLRFGR